MLVSRPGALFKFVGVLTLLVVLQRLGHAIRNMLSPPQYVCLNRTGCQLLARAVGSAPPRDDDVQDLLDWP
jgi:hypothetical protein